jgi:hypothetical protein
MLLFAALLLTIGITGGAHRWVDIAVGVTGAVVAIVTLCKTRRPVPVPVSAAPTTNLDHRR